MAITHKEIAEIVGVSRGTVDRALNNRGRVAPDVEKRIKQVAKEHGFAPSLIGRALARAKNPIKIGVIVHLATIPFFQEVINGIQKAKNDLINLGGELYLVEIPSFDAKLQIEAVDLLIEQGVQGLALSPIENDELRERLNYLTTEKNISIVTFNTDTKGINRKCFVGLDNIRGGQTAAGLMNIMLGKNGGKVLIISGFITNQANSQRVDGFVRELSTKFPQIQVPSVQFNMDTEESAYEITLAAIKNIPDLAGIYMVSSGQSGTCRALEDLEKSHEISLIVNDATEDTLKYIKNGTIDFIIDQNAFAQGNLPPHILFDLLFEEKEPANEFMYTDISIKTAYNT